ncbi:MAG: NHL repeat-containing protein, partial [Candidatus Glassbacteria bacterium]
LKNAAFPFLLDQDGYPDAPTTRSRTLSSRKIWESPLMNPLDHNRMGGYFRKEMKSLLGRHSSFTVILMFLALLLLGPFEATAGGGDKQTTLVYPPRSHALGHRATSNHLKLFLGKSARFKDPSGIACVKLKAWDDSKTESDDDELFVVLVNRGRKEILFNNSMTSITRLSGDSGLNLTDPRGVGVDESGNVYVADTVERHIVKLSLDEKNRLKFVSTFPDGAGAGEVLREPVGVCVSHDGRVFVADRSKNEIVIFSPEGNLLRSFEGGEVGENGIFKPIDVEVLTKDEPWNFFGSNSLYILDMDGKRIQKLSAEGEREEVFYAKDLGMLGASFSSIAVDYYSQVYVTDIKNHCIHKFDRKLRHLATFGKRGTGDGGFISPSGIAIWRRFGQVFVADSVSVQYLWIGTDVLLPGGVGKDSAIIRKNERGRSTIQVSFDITEPSEIHMHLEGSEGKNIPLIEWRRYFPKSLNLTLPLGKLSEEEYGDLLRLVIKARPTYSSKESFEKKVTLPVRVIR